MNECFAAREDTGKQGDLHFSSPSFPSSIRLFTPPSSLPSCCGAAFLAASTLSVPPEKPGR